MKSDPYLSPHIKINLNKLDLNTRSETMKPLEEDRGKAL
jgi:hypothetical protein